MKYACMLKYRKSTKGAHQFKEIDNDGALVAQNDTVIGTLYIRRRIMSTAPEVLMIMIDDMKGEEKE